MDSAAVIAAYHDLWQAEASFRMTKSDLRARPVFHHEREAIEAHLTVVRHKFRHRQVCPSLPSVSHADLTAGRAAKGRYRFLYCCRGWFALLACGWVGVVRGNPV